MAINSKLTVCPKFYETGEIMSRCLDNIERITSDYLRELVDDYKSKGLTLTKEILDQSQTEMMAMYEIYLSLV